MPLETIAHYKLKERLGAGAMGEVWLAEDTRLHRLVALKMIRGDAADDETAGARLLREARVASSLTHPNVAVIYEVGEAEVEGQPTRYIAMEYVKGRTLGDVLKNGPLTASAIIRSRRSWTVHGDFATLAPLNSVASPESLVAGVASASAGLRTFNCDRACRTRADFHARIFASDPASTASSSSVAASTSSAASR